MTGKFWTGFFGVCGLALVSNPLFSATPASGTVSSGSPSVTWEGGPFTVSNPAACPPDADAPGCDRYLLTIDAPASGGFEVEITTEPSSPSDDYDLYVYDGDGTAVGSSASGGGSERVLLDNPAEGTYTVVVEAFLVAAGSTYDGAANLSLQDPAEPPPVPSDQWTITKHGACCEANLAAQGDTSFVLLPKLVDGNAINRSNDGGQNWEKVYPPVDVSVPFGIEGDLQAIGDDVIYFGTELAQGVAARSDDRGDTWTVVQIPVAFAANDQAWSYLGPLTDVDDCPVPQTVPYVLAGWYRIGTVALFSCDGGLTWPIETPLVGNNGSGPIHIVCQNNAQPPASAGDTRIVDANFAKMKSGRHGNWGPDKRFYWSETDGTDLYVCATDDFGVNWSGTQHPLARGTPGGITVTLLAFDDNGTQYVMHDGKLYVSFDNGRSFAFTHDLPRSPNADTGDGGSTVFFVVEDGDMHLSASAPGPGAGNSIYYLRGKDVDSASPQWTEELVDIVPADGSAPVRLDFLQIAVDGNGIPTIGYTTPDGGTTTASRLQPPAADLDGDGIENVFDNCPEVANAGQADGDSDDVGDVCDNCIEISNASQCDTNDDGFGNRCDADLNNDLGVTQPDLGIFRSQFNMTGDDLDADLNCDGGVTQPDLGIFRALFNKPPGPSAFAP